MTPTSAQSRLAEIRKLRDAATKGPWSAKRVRSGIPGADHVEVHAPHPAGGHDCIARAIRVGGAKRSENAAFIATIHELATIAEALSAEVTRVRDDLSELVDRKVWTKIPPAEEVMAQFAKRDEARKAVMPDQQAALSMLMEAYLRLKELGWKDIMYCPKDGSVFDSISVGSTGVHACDYQGEWPDGRWTVYDGGDAYPTSCPPALWRSKAARPPEQSA